jgi:hypothetical protein
MRTSFFILCGLLLTGCASTSHQTACPALSHQDYAPSTTVALAFDPQLGVAAPQLARDDRDARAFGGFQSVTTELFDIQTNDDMQFYNYPSTYERNVMSDRIGEISR